MVGNRPTIPMIPLALVLGGHQAEGMELDEASIRRGGRRQRFSMEQNGRSLATLHLEHRWREPPASVE